MRSIITVLIAIVALAGATRLLAQAPTQDAKRAERAREVKEKVSKFGTGREAVVKVKLYNDTEYRGFVSRAGADDFDVTDVSGNPHTVRYDDVRSIGGKNMSTGKKLAIGIGIGAAATLIIFLIIFNELAKNS